MLGVPIVESLCMVEDGEPREVPRAWFDRLFTRPWRPFKATQTVVPKVPRIDALRLPNGTLVMHPETARRLRNTIHQRELNDKLEP